MTRPKVAAIAFATFLLLGTSEVANAKTEKITLQQALEQARSHPVLSLAQSEVEAARGREAQADTAAYNPEFAAGLGPRLGGGRTSLDFEIDLSQTLELGNKRALRTDSAKAQRLAAQSLEQWTQRAVALRVRRSFALASAARLELQTTAEAEELAVELKSTSDERLARGAGNLLEVNLAAAGVGRARRRRSEAERKLIRAEYELAASVGVDAQIRLSPVGAKLSARPARPNVDLLLDAARDNRSDQVALGHRYQATEASLRLARSLATPDLNVGTRLTREEGTSQILATLSIPLPFWNRNRGGIAEAQANRNTAKLTLEYGERELRRGVRSAAARYTAARDSVEAFDQDAVGKLADTLALTREAFERGKISMIEYNLLRTQFVDVRLAYLEAVAEEIRARYQLERAIGERLQ